MKKYLHLISFLAIILFSCSKYNYATYESYYKVYKIKLNNEYYEIYAKQGQRHYKIVSKKEDYDRGIKIKRGGYYKFTLKSNYDVFKEMFGVEMMPTHRIGEISLSENTVSKIDGGKITTIYYAKNLKGLYLIDE